MEAHSLPFEFVSLVFTFTMHACPFMVMGVVVTSLKLHVSQGRSGGPMGAQPPWVPLPLPEKAQPSPDLCTEYCGTRCNWLCPIKVVLNGFHHRTLAYLCNRTQTPMARG